MILRDLIKMFEDDPKYGDYELNFSHYFLYTEEDVQVVSDHPNRSWIFLRKTLLDRSMPIC